MMNTYDLEVDASGLLCPLPLLRLKKAMTQLDSGKIVKVIATDPAAHLDFGVYIEQAGHTAVMIHKEIERQVFFIQKK
jgi:tRNA 2-thiouridine synthesizing protein A